MKDKIVFITGGTSGLGKIATCELANKGATVIVLVRNEKKGKELLEFHKNSFPVSKGEIYLLEGDLSSFASTRKAVEEFQRRYDRLDILINNAGLWKNKLEKTIDGIEETFHVNLLASLLLSELLIGSLEKSANAKIIYTSSGLHQGTIQFEDIEYLKEFKGFNAYRQSKLAIILLTRLAAQKLAHKKIGVYCFHPGVVKTDLARESNFAMRTIFLSMGISPKKGAKTLIFLATESNEKLISGEYYYKNKVKKTTSESYDLELAQHLLLYSEKHVKGWLVTDKGVII